MTVGRTYISRPEEYDEPTSDILLHAGFTAVALGRCDLPIKTANDVEEAIDITMAIGPAGEILE